MNPAKRVRMLEPIEEEETKPGPQKPERSKKIHISPVDCFNQPLNDCPTHSNKFDIQGYLTDSEGLRWEVPEVTCRFGRINWRQRKRARCHAMEFGLLVSPGTRLTFEVMSSDEVEAYERWEDERYDADPEKLDPDMMSPFYEGILKWYGKRRVP